MGLLISIYIELYTFSSSEHTYINTFVEKWANPGLFFNLCLLFQTNITILTTNIWEKCPTSIWCQDLNPQPPGHETPPITTGPGLSPYINTFSLYLIVTLPALGFKIEPLRNG